MAVECFGERSRRATGAKGIFIPENVWHRPVVSKEADWVVVSFHTVPAEELIEERPIDHAASRTKQMVYLDKR